MCRPELITNHKIPFDRGVRHQPSNLEGRQLQFTAEYFELFRPKNKFKTNKKYDSDSNEIASNSSA